ncbi:MAG: flagellar hook assembly protein FlgD [Woeseiaceae bacterium]|nr:flagellar hook assembly protein FlgD [Woeseiaceae bacterium]
MVNPIDFESAGIAAPPPVDDGRGELGQEDFLTLMITQFQNQDPFEPMENGEFLGQLAQFSTVSGIEDLNSAFAQLSGALRGEQALQASSLVGRTILAQADTAFYDGASPLGGAVEIGASATRIEVDITDANGALVRRIDLGEQQAGTIQFDWDGRLADGDAAPAGTYQLSARVIRGTETESVPTYVRANVESVTLGQFGGDMTLNLTGGGRMPLDQVYQIN